MCYDKATAPTSGPQSGAMALYRHLVNSEAWGATTKGLGVYNNRPVRNGKSLSVHAEGRALDIGVPVSSDTGDRLYRALTQRSTELGIQQIFWDGHGWRCDRGEFNTSRGVTNLHRDHLHIELTRSAATSLRPSTVAGIFGESIPAPTVIIQEGDSGKSVAEFQKQVNRYGYSLKVDGDFGPKTRQVVIDFQEKHGLTPDGIVGPATRAKMRDVKPMAKVAKPAAQVHRPPSIAPAPTLIQPATFDPLETKKAERFEPKPPPKEQAPQGLVYTQAQLDEAVNTAIDRQMAILMDALGRANQDKG